MIDDLKLLTISSSSKKLEEAIATGPEAVKAVVADLVSTAYAAGLYQFNALTHELHSYGKNSWSSGFTRFPEEDFLIQTYLNVSNLC